MTAAITSTDPWSPPSTPPVGAARVSRQRPRRHSRRPAAAAPAEPSSRPEADAPDRGEQARAGRTLEYLRRAAASSGGERQDYLDRAVTLNMKVARSIARRYYNRGVASDDLDQVAYLSLVCAAQRFDPEAGHDFLAFAVPTIRGEIRRHFRDRGWTVRPPRRVQDTQRLVSAETDVLAQTLGRSPTASELAEHLGVREDDVLEAIAAQGCFRPTSLDRSVTHAGEQLALIDLMTGDPGDQSGADARVLLRDVVRELPPRDRRVLGLRFYEDLTQQQIADDLGMSQMQVSRILSRVLGHLRERLGGPDGGLARA